ncbi:MAG TPA: hypothetical protein PLV68_05370, partial [Ilumatobacteraceae bacterium]|nr:hypothetical protein [Ilumatobacteraceae bacterium]
GRVCVYTHTGADYALDVNGYVPSGSPVELARPARLLDTRRDSWATTVDGRHQGTGVVRAEQTVEIPIAGRGDVPRGATAALVTVTAVDPAAAGFLTVYPCGSRPHASSVNFAAGQTVPNGVIAELSASGSLCVYTNAATDLVVDVTGSVTGNGTGLGTFVPERLVDTRPDGPTIDGHNSGTPSRLRQGTTIEVQVAGRASVPADATAALLNIGLVAPDNTTFATLYPCGERPTASNVNLVAATSTRANSTVTKLSPSGTVCIYVHAATDLILDITGYLQHAEPAPRQST